MAFSFHQAIDNHILNLFDACGLLFWTQCRRYTGFPAQRKTWYDMHIRCSLLLNSARSRRSVTKKGPIFDENLVRRAHQWDKIDSGKYTLIYRDLGASRSFFMIGAFVPCFLLTIDAKELGSLVAVPLFAVLCVVALLTRLQQLRLLRIYQNKENVAEFVAVRSKFIVGTEKMHFNRELSVGCYMADESRSEGFRILFQFLFGNVQIDKSRFLIDDGMFRANNYRSFMLNETDVPPRL
ncbi:unnamed protein product [Caenorhabditis auriculariae]|uniref:Uncharacterized protein n=1 Tax=Caenorhabditis auriculariae TaxID=2777116 RepID=A0A8S1HRD5_9PELO|nr:unnamed protein product [Caenorhabditis auriculariae]